MDTEFNITSQFEKDRKRLSKDDERRVALSIDRYAAAFDTIQGKETHHVYQPKGLPSLHGFDSSLYVLRATQQLRVLLTIENDPLFDRKLITLLRVVKHDALEGAVASMAEALYHRIRDEG